MKKRIDYIFYNGYEIQFYQKDQKLQFVIVDAHSKDCIYESQFYDSSNIWKDAYDYLNKEVFGK